MQMRGPPHAIFLWNRSAAEETHLSLRRESKDLKTLLSGGRIYKPPFWEVWFGMSAFASRRYGDQSNVENRILMTQDLGMAIVPLGGVGINTGFNINEDTSAGVRRYAGGSLSEFRQLEERALPDWDSMIDPWRENQGLIRDAGLLSWAVIPWCLHTIATSMGLVKFVGKVYRDFDFVDRAFEWVEERSRMAIDSVIREVRPDVVLLDGDCAYKHGLMIHPALFRRLVYDRTRETVSHLRKLGIPYAFHTDGKLDDVIPMLVELGFSAVHGCEKTANDLGDLATRFGDRIVLIGNMDVTFLYLSNPADIVQETRAMLETGSRKGRYVAACNTSPLDNIPDDNYLAMVRSIAEYQPESARRSGEPR